VINEIVTCLPSPELEEYERLQSRKRRSPGQQRRMEELWKLASELHRRERGRVPTPENDLLLYAEAVGERMRSRRGHL
jgi:hypothetical protein